MHTHSWRCKAKSSGHIGFADRISMPGPAREMAISRPLPMAFAELANPVRQERGAPHQGNRGGYTYIPEPLHHLPGNRLSSDSRESPIIRSSRVLRKYQKFPDPCAKDSNLHQTNGKHKEKPHASLQNMWFSVAPQEGLEPTTLRLTAECSAIELLRLMRKRRCCSPFSTF